MVEIQENSSMAFEVVVLDDQQEKVTVRIEAYGKGSSGIRGALYRDRRPDLVIIDDPQDTEDSRSDTTMINDFEWFSSDIKFLGKHTRIFMIGNNLGAKCLIEQVITNAEFFNFAVNKIPIMDSEGNSAWPSRYTKEMILKERDDYKEAGKIDVWFRERMCVATSPDSQLFKQENFRYYDKLPENLSVYITVDLALSTKQTADYTVLYVNGVDKDNNWFAVDVVYGRWHPFETIDKIFETVAKYRPIYTGIESVAFQAVIKPLLEKEMPQRNIYFVIKDLKAEKKKELRIEMLQPRFIAGKIWFKKDASWLPEAEAQFLACTREGSKGMHDDIPDALAYMEQIALPPSGTFEDVADEDIPYAGGL
jgi:predicted phage terminase large subunit-like protein